MNEISNFTLFINSSFEFIALIVYLTMGTYLLLHVGVVKKFGENRVGRKTFIALSFSANTLVLLLRQFIGPSSFQSSLYDLSSLFILLQLFYPLAFHLKSVSGRETKILHNLIHTLLPLMLFNIVLIFLMKFNVTIDKTYIVILSSLLFFYLIFRIFQFTSSYCKYLKNLVREPFNIKRELFRTTLVITCISIMIATISDMIFSNESTLLNPSVIILSALSIIAVQSMLTEDKRMSIDNIGSYNEENYIITPNTRSIENHRKNEIKERLEEYFSSAKPYLNKKICIKEVAKKLYTNKTYLSKVINENMGVNFNQLVNSYRMKEVDRLLKEDRHMGMKELCDKSGFGCMATFVVAFRLYKGAPPAEWCKKNAPLIRNDAYLSEDE